LLYGADARPTANASPRMEELEVRYHDLMEQLARLLERPISE
jgi:hypothetical protein